MALIYGKYGGRSDGFQPGRFLVLCILLFGWFCLVGGASFETGFCPHGGKLGIDIFFDMTKLIGMSVSYDEFKKGSDSDLKPMRIHEGVMSWCFPLYYS